MGYNRFDPGCGCCQKCLTFRIGMSDDNYTPATGAELADQITRYSADPAVIVERTDRPSFLGKPAIAGHATWTAKRLAAPGGFFLKQAVQNWSFGETSGIVTDYDYSIIAAPDDVHPDDLETDPQSIILRAASAPGTGPWEGYTRHTLSLRGDGWTAPDYPLADGVQSTEFERPIIPLWMAWLTDSVETSFFSGPAAFVSLPVMNESGIFAAFLSRQLAANIPRRVHIRNHRPEPLVISFSGTRITDDRTSPRAGNIPPNENFPPVAGPAARCPTYVPLSPGTRRNDPIAIAATIAGGQPAVPRHYVAPFTSIELPSFGGVYTAETEFALGDPPASMDITDALYAGETVTIPVEPVHGVRVTFTNPHPHTTTGDSHPRELIDSTVTLAIDIVIRLYYPAVVGPFSFPVNWFDGEFTRDDNLLQRIVLALRFPPWDPGKMPPLTVTGSVAVGQDIGDYEVLSVEKPAQFVLPTALRIWLDFDAPPNDRIRREWVTDEFNPSVTITQHTGA